MSGGLAQALPETAVRKRGFLRTVVAPFYSIASSTMFDCDKLAICVRGPNCAHAVALFDIGENLFPDTFSILFHKNVI